LESASQQLFTTSQRRRPFGEQFARPKKRIELKLILNHQESRCTENHNIVKFRTLFGEAGLHKKGQTADFTLCAHSACAQNLTVQARAYYYLLFLLFNFEYFLLKVS
jgi:hypothetical protein